MLIRKSQRGYSLINVMMGLALAGIVGLIVTQVILSLIQSQTYVMQRQDAMSLQMRVGFELRDGVACSNSFAGINPSTPQLSGATPDPTIQAIRNFNNQVVFSENVPASREYGAVVIHDIRFVNYLAGAAGQSTSVDLELVLRGKTQVGPQFFSSIVKLVVKTDAAGLLTACRSFGVVDSEWELTSTNDIRRATGNVGIGMTTPASGAPPAPQSSLYVNGFVYARAFYWDSDRALKDHISKIQGLDIVRKLRGVKFDWRDSHESGIGVVAQEVETVLPEIVRQDESTKLKSVAYGGLAAPLIEAVKELHQRSERQAREIQELKKLADRCKL